MPLCYGYIDLCPAYMASKQLTCMCDGYCMPSSLMVSLHIAVFDSRACIKMAKLTVLGECS